MNIINQTLQNHCENIAHCMAIALVDIQARMVFGLSDAQALCADGALWEIIATGTGDLFCTACQTIGQICTYNTPCSSKEILINSGNMLYLFLRAPHDDHAFVFVFDGVAVLGLAMKQAREAMVQIAQTL